MCLFNATSTARFASKVFVLQYEYAYIPPTEILVASTVIVHSFPK